MCTHEGCDLSASLTVVINSRAASFGRTIVHCVLYSSGVMPKKIRNWNNVHTTSVWRALGLKRMKRILAAVWLTAFAIRCLYIWQISFAPFSDLRIGDAEAYHLWAHRIAAGDWLGQDVFYQSPTYPYFLALIYRTLGDGLTTVRLVHAVIGSFSCVLLATAAASLVGRRGALAGFALAFYPTAIFLDGLLEKTVLVTLLMSALLALLLRNNDGTLLRWSGVGSILGILSLTRENAALLIAPVVLWLISRRAVSGRKTLFSHSSVSDKRGQQRPVLQALALIAGWTLVIVPVVLRNSYVGGEVSLTTSQLGPNFYIGNHAGATGTYEPLVPGHGSAADERTDATRLAEQSTGLKLTPRQVSSFWLDQSLRYIRSHPGDWLKLMFRKVLLAINTAEIADTESMDVYAESSWLLRALRPFSFAVLLGAAAFGLLLHRKCRERLRLLLAMALTYALSVVLFYVLERYRFPLVPILITVGASGVSESLANFQQRNLGRLAAAGAIGGLTAAFASLPLHIPGNARATHYSGLATVVARDPARSGDAIELYKRALDSGPGFPPALWGLGTLYASLGRPEDAIIQYRATLKSWPDSPDVRYNLGLALTEIGDRDAAVYELNEALRLRPDGTEILVALGRTHLITNQPELAVHDYERVLALQPKHVSALVGLGVAFARLGRIDDAIARYSAALQIEPQNAEAHNNLGTTLANTGRIDEALAHFERAVALNPGNENARANLERARQVYKF